MRNAECGRVLILWALSLALAPMAWAAQAPPAPPAVVVTGQGVVSAAPDQVLLRLGASLQARQADAAQSQVNEIVQRTLEALRRLGIPAAEIRSVGLTLSPVYEQVDPRTRPGAPRVAGYRAAHTLQVLLHEVRRAGEVLDAAVAAGANQIEDPVFRLADEGRARQEALRLAVRDARAKAEAIAEAMGVRLVGVIEVTEGPVAIQRPRMEARLAAAPDAGTPVEPGQVRVEAAVTVRYRIADAGAPL
jgi:uncharacterized protein YggE